MTKKERAYFEKLVQDGNFMITQVYNKGPFCTAFGTKEQREYFIMGIAHAIEPYARYLGLEVVGVDLNHMKE